MSGEHPAVAHVRNAHRISEEHARKGTPGPWEPEGDDPTDDQVMTVHDGEHGDWVGGTVAFVRSGAWGRPEEGRTYANMCLIADHAAPEAVLRRVAAERGLLAEHAENWGHCTVCSEEDYDGAERAFRRPLLWPCPTVLAVARGWGWTETEKQP